MYLSKMLQTNFKMTDGINQFKKICTLTILGITIFTQPLCSGRI